jgi:hypothetical protein
MTKVQMFEIVTDKLGLVYREPVISTQSFVHKC